MSHIRKAEGVAGGDARAGCRSHEDELARLSTTKLRGLARSIVGSDDLAADAVQEALWDLSRQTSAPRDPERWLRTAVVHRGLQILRSERRRGRHERAAARDERCPLCNPESVAELGEISQSLEDALDTLCPEHRAVLQLRHENYETISRRLNISKGTVRSRLSRARAALRARLKGQALPESA